MKNSQYPVIDLPYFPVWNQQQQIQMMEKEEEEENPPAGGGANDGADDLGEAGKKALKAERDARAKAEKELKAFKDAEEKRKKDELSEVDQHKATIAEREAEVARLTAENRRYRIGIQEKVDPSLISRLQGDDDDSMVADAKVLAGLNPGSKGPKADPSQGRKADPGGTGATKQEDFVETIEGLFDNEHN